MGQGRHFTTPKSTAQHDGENGSIPKPLQGFDVRRVEQGFLYIPMGNDVRFLRAGAAAEVKQAKEATARLKG